MGMRVNNLPGGYVSWKSPNNYDIVPRNIKPFTNKDSSNNYNSVSRKPRPIKHYRKGIFINTENINRISKSSNGMPYLLQTLQDNPGSTSSTTSHNNNNNDQCNGLPVISVNNKLYNNTDTPTYQTDTVCCNKEQDALKRVIPTNTGYTPPTYYPSYSQYIHGKGNTYTQNVFDFEKISNPVLNTYVINNVVNKQPNCIKVAVYKPNNQQYANQGAVSSGTRILKLSTTTIERSNITSTNKLDINLSTCKNNCNI
jgi:hypothetical protein